MQEYTVNKRRRKKGLRAVRRANFKNMKCAVKICWFIATFLEIVAYVGGGYTLLYMIFWGDYFLDGYFEFLGFVMVFFVSWLPKIVYTMCIDREFRFRMRETIRLMPDGFSYRYHDDRIANQNSIFGYDIKYSQIEKIERNEKTRIITCYGSFTTVSYIGNSVTQTLACKALDFMDVYDGIDMKQVLEQALAAGKGNS